MAQVEVSVQDYLRLMEKIDVRGPDDCWEWKAKSSNGLGYGRFRIGGRKDGKLHYPHRLMWQIANDMEIPEGNEVCHDCENPSCCNPKHLFVDTHSANLQHFADRHPEAYEKRKKGNKLTLDDAREVRHLYATGKYSQYQLAALYEVSQSLIGQIVTNRIHKESNGTPVIGGARMSATDVMEGLN